MVRILLCCAAGMSTSLLVENMKKAAAEKGIEAKIWAVSESVVPQEEGNFDILLLGPQIRYKLKPVQKILAGKYPVEVIEMKNYGTMNGKAVFEQALRIYNEFYQG